MRDSCYILLKEKIYRRWSICILCLPPPPRTYGMYKHFGLRNISRKSTPEGVPMEWGLFSFSGYCSFFSDIFICIRNTASRHYYSVTLLFTVYIVCTKQYRNVDEGLYHLPSIYPLCAICDLYKIND